MSDSYTVHVRGLVVQCDTLDDLFKLVDRFGTLASAPIDFDGSKTKLVGDDGPSVTVGTQRYAADPREGVEPWSKRPEVGKLAEQIVYAITATFKQWPGSGAPRDKAEITTTWIELVEAKLRESVKK